MALIIAGLTLTGCAPIAGTETYPSLLPIDGILAEAEMTFIDPGPAQQQRAAQLRNRVAALTP